MPDRIVYCAVYCAPLVEDIKISHLNLLVPLERRDHKLRKPVLSEHPPLPRLPAASLAASTTYAAADAGANPKICEFLRKYRLRSAPVVRLSDPARDDRVR